MGGEVEVITPSYLVDVGGETSPDADFEKPLKCSVGKDSPDLLENLASDQVWSSYLETTARNVFHKDLAGCYRIGPWFIIERATHAIGIRAVDAGQPGICNQ